MNLLSSLPALALAAHLAAPAFAAPALAALPASPAARGASLAGGTGAAPASVRAPRAPRHRGDPATHIRIGCALLPRQTPRPIIVIIPSITVVVISVCWNPQDIFHMRRA